MKAAIYGAMAYLAVVLQTTLLARVQIFGVKPDLICALLTCVAAVAGPLVGAIVGALSGLMLDFMFMMPGFYALQYLLIGFFVGLLAAQFPFDRLFLPAIACFAGFVLKELFIMSYVYLQRVEIDFSVAIGKLFVGGLYTVLLVVPLYQGVLQIGKIGFGEDPVFGGRRG